MKNIADWLTELTRRVLPNTQAVSFAVFVLVTTTLIITLGKILMPVFAGGVIAYLLDGLVMMAVRKGAPRSVAVIVIFLLFMAFLGLLVFLILPSLYQQTIQLIQQLPSWANRAQILILELPDKYPDIISESQILEVTMSARRELLTWGQTMLSYSYASLISLITVIIYLILLPLLVFFFLKDKDAILRWVLRYLPSDRYLSGRVWHEVDTQIGNYVRGKIIEVFALFLASFVVFWLMNLNYALLLAVCMGLSVIIPYVGATLVTFPVVLVAFFQWGVGENFGYLLLAYAILQTIDAVALIPILFSEVVNIHPVAIITAILFFGGLWGFWGIFFAIPLATLVNAILHAWPMSERVLSTGRDPSGERP